MSGGIGTGRQAPFNRGLLQFACIFYHRLYGSVQGTQGFGKRTNISFAVDIYLDVEITGCQFVGVVYQFDQFHVLEHCILLDKTIKI